MFFYHQMNLLTHDTWEYFVNMLDTVSMHMLGHTNKYIHMIIGVRYSYAHTDIVYKSVVFGYESITAWMIPGYVISRRSLHAAIERSGFNVITEWINQGNELIDEDFIPAIKSRDINMVNFMCEHGEVSHSWMQTIIEIIAKTDHVDIFLKLVPAEYMHGSFAYFRLSVECSVDILEHLRSTSSDKERWYQRMLVTAQQQGNHQMIKHCKEHWL